MLEGALTWTSIRDHWQNTINSYCERDEPTRRFCEWARSTISANFVTIKEYASAHSRHDHYWHQIHLFCWQLEGLATGWRSGVARSNEELEMDLSEFLLLNAAADLPDMRIYYENIVNPSTEYEYHSTPVKASMLVKFLFGTTTTGEQQQGRPEKVLLGHSSDGSYASMLRVHKKYKFHFHHTSSTNREVFGVDIAFTGYPGALASSDDFYIVNGGYTKLTVAGIRIENNNIDLWNRVDVTRAILLSARVMAANRLAHSGRSWAKLMALNSSFGTKQWIVIDVKRIHNETSIANQTAAAELTVEPLPVNGLSADGFGSAGGSTSDRPEVVAIDELHLSPKVRSRNGAVWIIDQLPGRLYGEDMTKEIVYEDGFWTGNGIPYFDETRQLSNIEDTVAAKKSALKVSNANIMDLDAVSKVLKSRAYRGDLMGTNATAFGNIDIKLYSETNSGKMVFRALAGPVYYKQQQQQQQPPPPPKQQQAPIESTISTTLEANNDNNDTTTTADDDDSLEALDGGQMDEIDIFSDRRLVRGDFRAAAMVNSNGPFRWSNAKLNHHEHVGHPDVWNFEAVSPTWAWKHDTI